MERMSSFYSAGIRLAANVHLPNDLRHGESRAGVVLCHGFGGIRKHVLPMVAQVFADAGYVVLRFDYRGFGDSEGTRGRIVPMEQVEDIRSALTYLAAQPEVDPERIGVYGSSFGGANAVFVAGIDERARCVVSTVGVGNGRRWLQRLRRHWEWIEFLKALEEDRVKRVAGGESKRVSPDVIAVPDPGTHEWHEEVHRQFPERKYMLSLETADYLLEYRPEDVVHQIAPRPLLLIHVEDDLLVPTEESEILYERAGEPKKLILMRGLAHHDVYAGDHFEEVMKHALAWFEDHLPARERQRH